MKSVKKDVFLYADTPEEVILAILCDFGEDKPVAVLRMLQSGKYDMSEMTAIAGVAEEFVLQVAQKHGVMLGER